ncbi:DNA polymerase iota-like [Empidonax traillii]|uniref:DNA polymerase iota-like n=1 Tax=Empidonax traillii TaxID=164674 RepID=UPI000FFD267E|nr:DNA polymerase iota-like [Empidonax traillii]
MEERQEEERDEEELEELPAPRGFFSLLELLEEFCPLVERLGLDENFVDITELVGKRLQQLEFGHSQIQACGHIYNQQGINLQDPRHLQLILGSQVAQEFRNSLKSRLGLTGCAGVAPSKLLAKLVSGTFKPDQQTLLLPENHQDLLSSLEHIQKLPGIGHRTSQRLESLGIRTVRELQDFPGVLLEKEFGFSTAQKLRKISSGEDDSPVIPSGPPQSFSDEDSFPKCSSEAEAKEKLRQLLPNLLDRISKDGRQPHTVRLSIRRFSSRDRGIQRESRQCPIPSHLIPKFGKGNSTLIPPLLEILMKLLGKMIPLEFPFHLTLLSISFSNLKEIPNRKNSISFYLKPSTSKEEKEGISSAKIRRIPEEIPAFPGPSSAGTSGMPSQGKPAGIFPPPGVDPEVFWELPPELREEVAAEWKNREKNPQNSRENSQKTLKGKRKNPGSSQSKSLLDYWKGR